MRELGHPLIVNFELFLLLARCIVFAYVTLLDLLE